MQPLSTTRDAAALVVQSRVCDTQSCCSCLVNQRPADVKNPITLAKMILETSSQPLSLRRVAPNILVGIGAKEFAYEHGIVTIPNDFLVSKNARDRFIRWNDDLQRAEGKAMEAVSPISPENSHAVAAYEQEAVPSGAGTCRDHAKAILTGTWNEGQPDSPDHGPVTSAAGIDQILSRPLTPSGSRQARTPPRSPLSPTEASHSEAADTSTHSSNTKRQRVLGPRGGSGPRFMMRPLGPVVSAADTTSGNPNHDGSILDECTAPPEQVSSPATELAPELDGSHPTEEHDFGGLDRLTDTVGAIAIDLKGNIAAASSSGGIGMKHQGRMGPAALVGIGTAVVPVDLTDHDQTSVAAVTSGTGEHMATTMASQRCAERLYYNQRRGPGGTLVSEFDEDAIMESFVNDDFMNHPGVKNPSSVGAIGVMAVKKTRNGHYFYFAHNTDSFALASMSSVDKDAKVVMSRIGENTKIARGGSRTKVD